MSVSPHDILARHIMDGLYEGRFSPGQRLVEADLMERYQTSRGAVREALSRLEAAGVVQITRNKGASIRMLSRKAARNIIVVSEVLNGLMARLAAENIDQPGARTTLRDAYELLQASRDLAGLRDRVQARNAYYRALIDIGGNRELARVLPNTDLHLTRTQFRQYDFEYERERFDLYRDLHDAVLGGDAQAAEAIGRARTRRLLGDLDGLPDEAFAPED
ncbi:GntR family transcriptional regulator [Phenylobacterium sp.]|uniref:GntR family transcriptional regulator n=1 Tax=Phenylobacterium sp. TaxID=1871053 RepID=UPI002735E42D|nr:GntR family transcriptional regulator [Phenylobacterium sp.]MDP3659418.1 GntR family transcriptional regulator [Phenylobacterium sp.]